MVQSNPESIPEFNLMARFFFPKCKYVVQKKFIGIHVKGQGDKSVLKIVKFWSNSEKVPNGKMKIAIEI